MSIEGLMTGNRKDRPQAGACWLLERAKLHQRAGDFTLPQMAYILATAAWETGWTCEPISEKRAKEGTRAWKLQESYWYTKYCGRGYVQLTREPIYRTVGSRLAGLPHIDAGHIFVLAADDLIHQPDLAFNHEISWATLWRGMMEGWFTGRRLGQYITESSTDFVNARRVVNGLDRAKTIAALADAILRELEGQP